MAASLAGRPTSRRFVISQNHEMNVTPFVDVLLVLLIVFIIAAPLATTALKIDIAAGQGGAPSAPPVLIAIDDAGQVQVGYAAGALSPSSADRIAADVRRLSGGIGPGQQPILISSAAHTRYGAFVAVVDHLHSAGYDRVTISRAAGA